MTRVNVDSDTGHDPRFPKLARVLQRFVDVPPGLESWFEDATRWKTVRVWFACYARRSPVLTMEEIDLAAGKGGFADAMVLAGLARAADGEASAQAFASRALERIAKRAAGDVIPLLEDADFRLHVSGVRRRIDYLLEQSERGRSGGRSSAEGRKNRGVTREANAQANASTTAQAVVEAPLRTPLKPTSGSGSGSGSGSSSGSGKRGERAARAASKASEQGGDDWLDIPDPTAGGDDQDASASQERTISRRKAGKQSTRTPEPGSSPGDSGASGDRSHPEGSDAIDGFHQLYLAARGVKPTWPGKQIARVHRFLLDNRIGAAEFLRRAEIMFRSAPKWPADHGGDLDTLLAHFDKFASGIASKPGGRRTALDAALDIVAEEEAEA